MSAKFITILALFFTSFESLGQEVQVNCIIQVNKELVEGQLADIKIWFSDNMDKKYQVGYVPGELSIPKEAYQRLIDQKDTIQAVLNFDYYNYDKKNQRDIVNWSIKLTGILFKQPYLILDIYDFRVRKYRKMYSFHTDQNFIYEWNFPNSGMLISK